MASLIRCDRCGKIVELRSVRADLIMDVFLPGGTVDSMLGKMKVNGHSERIDADLCEDCMKELCEFLGKKVPE